MKEKETISLYPEASPEERRKLGAIREDALGLVRFLFQSPSPDTSESDRISRIAQIPETIRRADQ